MKRPQGFDPTPEPTKQTKPARPAKQPKQPRQAAQPTQPAAQKQARQRPAPRPPRRPAVEPSGPTKRELRRAARERRRVERQEVRRFTKRVRNQRAVWFTTIGVVLGLGGMLAIAVFSPLLAFTKLEVKGATHIDESDVRTVIEAQLGTPLALIDYDAIGDGLARFPLIRSYVTEVTPPGTLTVHLVERAPVGVLRTEAGFAVVDPAGVVLARPTERPDDLPRINVDSDGAAGVGFAAVVEVLLALPPALRANVDTAVATTKDDVRLALRNGGQSVVWGSADRSDLKARVLEQLIVANGSRSNLEYDVSAPLSPVVRTGG